MPTRLIPVVKLCLTIAIALGLASLVSPCHSINLPDPQRYPAEPVHIPAPATAVLGTRLQRIYKTRITEGAKLEPNFAGHYRLVVWGCGMDSYMFFVVDSLSGKVFDPPQLCITLAGGGPEIPGYGLSNPWFKLTSKLLLTVGVEDAPNAHPDDRWASIYLFDRGKFTRIYRAQAPLME